MSVTDETFAENLMIGMPYHGNPSIGPELDGMTFTVLTVENLGPDMASPDDPDMIELSVEVGVAVWHNVIVPADGTANLVPATD